MTKVALIAAYDKKGHLLFGVRRDNGKYTLPGGHLKAGETPQKAATRELLEETGLKPIELELLKEHDTDRGVHLYCFKALVDGKPTGKHDPDEECGVWDFVDISKGIPKKIYENLHGPDDDDNLVRQLYDMKKAESVPQDTEVLDFLDGPPCTQDENGVYVYGLDDAVRHYKQILKAVKCQAYETLLKEEPGEDDEIMRLLKHPNQTERLAALKLDGVQYKHLVYAAGSSAVDESDAAISILRSNPAYIQQALLDPLTTMSPSFSSRLLRNNPKSTVANTRLFWNRYHYLPESPQLDADFIREIAPEIVGVWWQNGPNALSASVGEIGKSKETPPDVLELLVDKVPHLYASFIINPNLSEDLVKKLYFGNPEKELGFTAWNRQKAILNELAHPREGRAVHIPQELLDHAVEAYPPIIEKLPLSEEQIDSLAKKGRQEDSGILASLIANPGFTSAHAEKYILNDHPQLNRMRTLIEKEKITPEQANRLFSSPAVLPGHDRWYLAVALSKKPNLYSKELLQNLMRSSGRNEALDVDSILKSVEDNPQLASPEFWEAASKEYPSFVGKSLAAPQHILRRIIGEDDAPLYDVLQNPNLDQETLSVATDAVERLGPHIAAELTSVLLGHPSLQTKDLERAINLTSQITYNYTSNTELRKISNHPAMTPELTQKLVTSTDNEIKYRIGAFSPHLSQETAVSLYNDFEAGKLRHLPGIGPILRNNKAFPVDLLKKYIEKNGLTTGILEDRGDELDTDFLKKVIEHSPVVANQEYLQEYIKKFRPDAFHKKSVGVTMGTAKLRKLRDMILDRGLKDIRPKDLGVPISKELNFAKLPNGNISAEKLQQGIDSAEKNRFNVSHGTWNGAQKHSEEASEVFQLNLTDEHVKKLKEAGAWDAWREAQSSTTGHPVTPTTVGWVRYTVKKNNKPVSDNVIKRMEEVNKYKNHMYHWSKSMYDLTDAVEERTSTLPQEEQQKWHSLKNDAGAEIGIATASMGYQHPNKEKYQPLIDEAKKIPELEALASRVPDPDEFKELRPLSSRLVEENNRVVRILAPKIESEELHFSPEEQAEVRRIHKDHRDAVQKMKDHSDVIPPKARSGFVDWVRKYVPDAFVNIPTKPKTKPKSKNIPHIDPKSGYHVDEIQSDFAQSWAKKAAASAKKDAEKNVPENLSEDEKKVYIEKRTQSGFNRGNELWPEDKYKKFTDIVFGKHHANKILGEAFFQHLRDKGDYATPVHINSVESGTHIRVRDGHLKPDQPLPLHVKISFEDAPKSLGLEPKQYGDLHTQTNEKMKGMPTWGGIARKREEYVADLVKAMSPAAFASIAKATTPAGPDTVDHVPHLSAHSPAIGHEVEAYHQLQSSPDIKKPIPKTRDMGVGISRKVLFSTMVPGSEQPTKFMVKPYHESIPKRVNWNKFPIQGWAEMTNQALYHAGDIGHLHQKVHVSEHNMGPGYEKEPALVIHMEHGYLPVSGASKESVTPQTRDDLHKIAVMDFLSNNCDRHTNNLLINPEGKVKAVDHSRSFQYVSNPYYVARGETAHKLSKRPYLNDNFGDYHESSRNTAIGWLEPMLDQNIKNPAERAYDTMYRYEPAFDWWSEKGPAIRQEFDKHLEQIKDPEIRDHLKRNFSARADWLDERANFGITNYGHTWYKDYEVPMYRPGEKSDEKIEQQKNERLAQIAGWKK